MILAISTSFVELIFMGTYLRFIKKEQLFGDWVWSGFYFTCSFRIKLFMLAD